jgi:7-alpha-hydroxysteroid dehydrogenase
VSDEAVHDRRSDDERPHGPPDTTVPVLDRFRLDGQVAVVSGGGAGIGRACAVALAQAGADVVVAARTQADLDETVRLVEATGRRGLAVVTDVMEEDQLVALVERTVEQFGRLDILVNNAGGTGPRPAMQTSARYFETALHFNATAPFLLSKRAAQAMVDTGGAGAIVNISSRSGDMVMTAFVAYGAGKAALNMVTQDLAADLAPRIRVNAIAVGGVATQAMDFVANDPGLLAQFIDGTPMARIGQPEDIAAAVVYLASPASSWVTGTILRVDGGTHRPAFEIPVAPIEPSPGD